MQNTTAQSSANVSTNREPKPFEAVSKLVADAITESELACALRKIGSTRAEMHDQACFGFANLAGRVARLNNCSAPQAINHHYLASAGFWAGVREAAVH